MYLKPNTPIAEIRPDKVFIGACTNSRIEDLRLAAQVVKGRKVASSIKLAIVVPGSGLVKQQAEKEGLDKVFTAAGFEWREPGCSMCLAMNPDKLAAGERAASRSKRHFEGRQGRHVRDPEGPVIVMEPVHIISGTAVPLDRSDVDTDQIIPAAWLKRVERTGFGVGLFSAW